VEVLLELVTSEELANPSHLKFFEGDVFNFFNKNLEGCFGIFLEI